MELEKKLEKKKKRFCAEARENFQGQSTWDLINRSTGSTTNHRDRLQICTWTVGTVRDRRQDLAMRNQCAGLVRRGSPGELRVMSNRAFTHITVPDIAKENEKAQNIDEDAGDTSSRPVLYNWRPLPGFV